MSGIGLVLNVAKDALLTQQYAIDVVSHNITNVSTEGYTRQSPILEAKDAAPYGGFIFGRGVELNDIIRNANEFIEKRLRNCQSDLLAMTEKSLYMGVIESIFDENSGRSLSNQMVDFWNVWNDLSNNPSGQPERSLLAENASLLTETFRDLSSDLIKLDQEIDKSIQAGIGEVNQILTQIADINKQILVLEVSGNANDLRDQRNMLVNKLSK
ncbi:MAG: flagellar hook-associated protein FlgK, partial [Deltaproteobacteria bacterium]|nr:flagellar hook-associated protein FlgK [Deltaproteobacteria bacterium]